MEDAYATMTEAMHAMAEVLVDEKSDTDSVYDCSDKW